MSPKVFFAALAQETNVFGPLPTGLDSFSGRFVLGKRTSTGEPPFPEVLLARLAQLAPEGAVRLATGPVAGAHPSGVVTRRAYESLRDRLLAELVAGEPFDIVALHLHGAMMADGYLDCEGDLLTRIRSVTGPRVVIGALLDPHAHLSAAMVEAADFLVAYKEYPHTDFRERADELVELLLRAHRGSIRPCAALWDAGVIGVFHTRRAEVRALVDRMQGLERSHAALTVSLIHGFPWGDTPDLGTRALAITDGDPDAADRLAGEIAASAQSIAVATRGETTPLAVALEELSQAPVGERPVVWADTADNPGGGAAGDSTYVLTALVASGLDRICLGPLWDPMTVDVAFNLGVGGRAALRIGGKSGPHSGAPLDLQAEVLALSAEASQTFAGALFPLGRAAALRCGGIDIVVTSVRDQARGTDLFTTLGIPLEGRRLIVVKSSQHFYASFAPIASRIVYLDCPGSLQSDFATFPYQHVTRPRWPLDAKPPAPWRVASRSRAHR
jgi:microcystin degradation protein MlrC